MNDVLLSVDCLSKCYGKTSVVNELSFSVLKGEVFGLLGPNGAGKTTTIKMICGLLKADSGRIVLDGISLAEGYNQVKSMIGLCPQDIVVWEQLTCFEQLKFMGMAYGLTSRSAKEITENLLERLGLIEKRNKLAKTLSGGMQRRLNIALALVHDPKLIILDEPQAGLDPQSRILVRDFIRDLAKYKTVILTTHDMDEADRLSDRIAVIDHGSILVLDTPQKIKDNSGMRDVLQVKLSGINLNNKDRLLNEIPVAFSEKSFGDNILLLGANNIFELIPIAVDTLKKLNIGIEDMTIRKRTLEDVFISMTGRRLRE